MPGNLTLETLTQAVDEGAVDTVVAAMVDMQGRLVGKRFHAGYFLDEAFQHTHACDYLLANDIDMEPVPGYAATDWSGGYGDFVLKPDLTTLRMTPWMDGAALVLCDVLDADGQAIAHSPRAILQQQLSRVAALGCEAKFASELEFYSFDHSFQSAHDHGYRDLKLTSTYIQDYHVLQTAKEEPLMRRVRNDLVGAGIRVENTKGEWGPGQQEINVRYADPLSMADDHSIAKNAIKEMAYLDGKAVTFMAKWDRELAGNSCHVHQSLIKDNRSAFFDPDMPEGMSTMMRQYVAGQLLYAREFTWFLAPFVNSYKRFQAATFAPTKVVWSFDNRTAGFRVVGRRGSGVRVECRIGGADLNPYLAFAALIAAGIRGIRDGLELADAFAGDAYATDLPDVPSRLQDAIQLLDESTMLREAFGSAVVDHYVHTAQWEQHCFDQQVTDWELRRGFERY